MANVIKEIKEDIEKGKEAIEEIIEEIRETPKKEKTKSKKTLKKEVKENNKEEIKKAEEESINTSKTDEIKKKEEEKPLEERKKELLKKAKEISKKIDVTKTEELKEKVKIKKKSEMLLPLDEYVKSGIYLGTKAVTPDMKPFVYRRRADGLAIFNTDLIDEKLKDGIEYLSSFEVKDIILACKRKAGWKAAEMFSYFTGIRTFTEKYPAGILTNIKLPDFFENELTIVVDSWLDKNALNDTLKVNKKVLMICDTNNFSKGANKIIIGNNKSAKSLSIIFYLLTKGFCKAKGIDDSKIPELEEWVSEKE